jgi:diguanylate cyclase (GGDEF)-like protein
MVVGFFVFFVDLSDFKKTNDDYGHHFGDEILEVFTRRLRH